MFSELIDKLKSLTREAVPFDASVFNDPVALKTEWSPAKRGGASFKTHKMVVVNSRRIKFKSSLGAKVFYSIFSLVGISFIIFFWIPLFEDNFNNVAQFELWIPLVFGSIFALAGGLMYCFGSRPIVFDISNGLYWKGWKNPETVLNWHELKNCVKLKNIHAIQLISEYVRGNKSSFYSYELNLVLKDATRFNVVDHGNKEQIIKDAKVLSEFLDKPVWIAF